MKLSKENKLLLEDLKDVVVCLSEIGPIDTDSKEVKFQKWLDKKERILGQISEMDENQKSLFTTQYELWMHANIHKK